MMYRLLFILLLTGCATVNNPVTVTLDGSGSHGNGASLILYSWKQVYGMPIPIYKPNDIKTNISIKKPAIYKFELTVVDGNGLMDVDTVMITVR